ncbi:MAG TPA: HEPN domain-containing protein [Candidatus Paenibacillus intestinavium]|nr:HEPN domain-containing protein [Candidatus Paenibacillus intestinavium]
MDKVELIDYWIDSSESDFGTMINLYQSKDYHWSLFIGHLVIEKLLKAIFIKRTSLDHPPRTHDLLLLCEKSKLLTDEMQKDALDLITTFNISARYPDYKKKFYEKCTEDYASKQIDKIKEMRIWLKSILEEK